MLGNTSAGPSGASQLVYPPRQDFEALDIPSLKPKTIYLLYLSCAIIIISYTMNSTAVLGKYIVYGSSNDKRQSHRSNHRTHSSVQWGYRAVSFGHEMALDNIFDDP